MAITPEKLRQLAKMSPMFAAEFNAAADEIERLQKECYMLSRKDAVAITWIRK